MGVEAVALLTDPSQGHFSIYDWLLVFSHACLGMQSTGLAIGLVFACLPQACSPHWSLKRQFLKSSLWKPFFILVGPSAVSQDPCKCVPVALEGMR